METTLIYTIILQVTAPLLAFLLFKLTNDETELIKYYFPVILWILAVASAIFYTTNIQYALITTYIFITMFTWLYLAKNHNERKLKKNPNKNLKSSKKK